MREADFQNTKETQGLEGFNRHGDEFNFGSEIHRLILTHDPTFTYGHYVVDGRQELIGQATVGGAKIGNRLYYAVALCSPSDNFSKSRGRALVHNHLINAEHSRKRSVMILPENDALPPAQLLKLALEQYLSKLSHKPSWANNAIVRFRTPRKSGKKPGVAPAGIGSVLAHEFRRPHGATRRPGSR
jgi:hypothetical protein